MDRRFNVLLLTSLRARGVPERRRRSRGAAATRAGTAGREPRVERRDVQRAGIDTENSRPALSWARSRSRTSAQASSTGAHRLPLHGGVFAEATVATADPAAPATRT